MRILVLGASGMLGSAMIRVLDEHGDFDVYGSARSIDVGRFFPTKIAQRLISGVDVENHDALITAFSQVRPQLVINCVGLIKQLSEASDPLRSIPVNALLPHRLARLCGVSGARLVHISTDCVFSGGQGGYSESDPSDARDLYGVSKYLGEVHYPDTVTLRTSIIGHALDNSNGLIDWFLAQQGQCRGFTRAVFSGLPSVVLAQVVRDVIIPDSGLHGLYHVAADPIAKFDLLELVAEVYGKSIEIIPDDSLQVDRSLNAERFRAATDYVVPDWPELIRVMHSYYSKAVN
ncbi:MAG: SDR family oxidoreductase [Thiogranum sp.]